MNFRTTCVAAAAAAVLVSASLPAFAGTTPALSRLTLEKPVDLGPASASEVKHLALALKIVDRPKLEAYIASTTDRSSPNFRKFLTPQQFKAAYGQSDAAIARVQAYLSARGIGVTKVYGNNLLLGITATNRQIADVFGSPVHSYKLKASTYQAPAGATTIPAEIGSVVGAVAGLGYRPKLKPQYTVGPTTGAFAAEANVKPLVAPTPKTAATGVPGQYTVADVANLYNVNPLYARGLTGKGVTIGIITFAGFDPADAYAYWAALGLKVDPNRITRVPVDGGSGDDAGAIETTLDVQQSGGLAPGAKIRVYEAPNTALGAIDLYFTAVNDNMADTLSTSWGTPEILGQDPTELPIYDAIFLQAAAQGMPLSAASGDSGSYDLNYYFPYPTCSAILSVDFPSSHPYVFAAGGTTLPGTVQRRKGTVNVPVERPWAGDTYRDYYLKYYNQSLYYTSELASGGGGGVALYYDVPSYQNNLPGVKLSQPAQSLYCSDPSGATDYVDLPRNFAGRNTPDVSLNADPFTGYLIYFQGNYFAAGGTSFVAPQLNGMFALISEELKGRVGFPHPQFYRAFKAQGYGVGSPFRPVLSGDNQFYTAGDHYNPATGLGTLDVDNLSKTLSAK